jgi:hypothetical protein
LKQHVPEKVFSVSVISTRLIIRFLLSTTHSRVHAGFVISFLDDAGQRSKHRVVFTKKYRYKVQNIITPVETCKFGEEPDVQETTRRVGMCHTRLHNTENLFSNVRCERDFLIERFSRCSLRSIQYFVHLVKHRGECRQRIYILFGIRTSGYVQSR